MYYDEITYCIRFADGHLNHIQLQQNLLRNICFDWFCDVCVQQQRENAHENK